MRRRDLLKGLAAAPIAFLFHNGADAFDEKDLPVGHKTSSGLRHGNCNVIAARPKPLSFGVTDQMQDLIQKAGDKDFNIAFPAQQTIIDAMQKPFEQTVFDEVRGSYWCASSEFAEYEHTYAVAADMHLRYLKDGRWDILTYTFTTTAKQLAAKINDAKQNTLISEICLCHDPCLHKQKRFGFYAYVELS
jgi:hypothetical protein